MIQYDTAVPFSTIDQRRRDQTFNSIVFKPTYLPSRLIQKPVRERQARVDDNTQPQSMLLKTSVRIGEQHTTATYTRAPAAAVIPWHWYRSPKQLNKNQKQETAALIRPEDGVPRKNFFRGSRRGVARTGNEGLRVLEEGRQWWTLPRARCR